MDYYDISPLISSDIAVFPGDKPFSRHVTMSIHDSHLELSSIETSLHIGAHADAPVHYNANGESIAERDLSFYLGHCQVIDVSDETSLITVACLQSKSINTERILFKTRSFPAPNKWTNDFTAIAPEVIQFLADKNVKLVGIDTPSVDPATSKTLDCHQAIFHTNMAILEGLVLDEVPENEYYLIALPLKIKNGDASPVRAILRPIP